MTIGRKMDAAWKKAISDGKKKLGIGKNSFKDNMKLAGKTVAGVGGATAAGLGAAGLASGIANKRGVINSLKSAAAVMPGNAVRGGIMFGVPAAVAAVAGKKIYDRTKNSNPVKKAIKKNIK